MTERSGDSQLSAVVSVEHEFGFPRDPHSQHPKFVDAASSMKHPDGRPLLDDALNNRLRTYWVRYGAQ